MEVCPSLEFSPKLAHKYGLILVPNLNSNPNLYRLNGNHGGEPTLKALEADYTSSETLYTKRQMKGGNVTGNFGSIFKAVRKSDDRPVAIKMLKVDEESTEGSTHIKLESFLYSVDLNRVDMTSIFRLLRQYLAGNMHA